MTPEHQSHHRVSDVARHYRHRALCEGMSAVTFAQRLADAYHAITDVPDRVIEFHLGATAEGQLRAMKVNAKIVERLVNGDIRLPADLLEAWCDALPKHLALECRRELARRLGFLGALMPEPSPGGTTADVATLAAEFGETVQALAPLMADGRIDNTDCPQMIRKALAEGADLMAAWATMQARLVAALGEATQ